jgi:hypothetical protein
VKEAFAVLSGLAAMTVLSASALAAGPNGATAHADGRTTIATGAGAAAVLPRQSLGVDGLKEIYSTYNTDPNNAYDCCSGWTISAEGSVVGARQDVAMPFTPSANYAVKTISVAVGYVTGTNGVTVSLNADAGGVPGGVIKKGHVTGLPTFGTCCVTVSIGTKGSPVNAGTQYWVVVKTDKKTPDTWDAWNMNNVGLQGTFAFNTGTGWQASSGPLGAFNVVGKKL